MEGKLEGTSIPCELCTGDTVCRKSDGSLMTSVEWCTEMEECAADIDWEKVYGR